MNLSKKINKMYKLVFLILILFSLLILVLGCNKDQEKNINDSKEFNLTKKIHSLDYDQIFDTCIKTCQDEIYYTKSEQENDLELCDKIQDKNLKKDCKNRFYYYQALDSNDISICNNINSSYEKENCIIDVIIQQTDNIKADIDTKLKSCEEISDINLILSCKENIIFIQARKDADIQICEKLSSDTKIIQCKDEINFEQAIKRSEIEICERIKDSSIKENCIYLLTQEL